MNETDAKVLLMNAGTFALSFAQIEMTLKISLLVIWDLSLRPSIAGMLGDDPVAITQFFAEYTLFSNCILWLSRKEGLPNITLAPILQNLSSESCFCKVFMTDLILLTTSL